MSGEELEGKINEIVQIAERLPDRYREKCFEILLTRHLSDGSSKEEKTEPAAPVWDTKPTPKFTVPIDVKAFMTQYKVSEDTITKLFLVEGTEIRPIYQVNDKVKSDGQMKVALLTALENALKPSGSFVFAVEEVRKRSAEHGVYDSANFMANFKNSSRLFKGLKNKESVELSPDGKAELAEAISAVLG